MSLPTQIGDNVAFHVETVGTQPKAIMDSAEAIEAVVSILIRSHPDNPGGSVIYVGDSVNQPWPLAVGESFGLSVTRRGVIHVYGSAEDLKLIVAAVLTSGKVPKQRIGL